MFRLDTSRLILVSTPMHVLKTRLEQRHGFEAPLDLPRSLEHQPALHLQVHFPAEWPGPDALDVFPMWMDQLTLDPDFDRWGGVGLILERATYVAVGGMGCKGPPDAAGVVEIGYAVSPAYRGRGYATEMAGAYVQWLERQPAVRCVRAECLITNHASARVLEKAGFKRTGSRVDAEGMLATWEHVRAE